MTGISGKLKEDIRAVGEKYGVDKIVLFGSRARDDNEERSDIDLAVFVPPKFTAKARIWFDLDDLETLLEIDAVIIDEDYDTDGNADFLRRINEEGTVIYGI